MDGPASPSMPVNLSVNKSCHESSVAIAKAEATPEESQEIVVMSRSIPIIKTEPEDCMAYDGIPLEDESIPSEYEVNPSGIPEEESTLPVSPSHLANNFNGMFSGGMNSVNSIGIPVNAPLINPIVVKQEPEVDEMDTEPPTESFSIPKMTCFENPRPVMMVKSEPILDEFPTHSRSDEEDSNDEFSESNWLHLLNKKALCLVCNGPCRVTRNRKIPTLPLCKKCKKAYFYQVSHKEKGKKSKTKCHKEGQCVIDYSHPKTWCTSCHMKKFRSILKSKGNITELSQNTSIESDEVTREDLKIFKERFFPLKKKPVGRPRKVHGTSPKMPLKEPDKCVREMADGSSHKSHEEDSFVSGGKELVVKVKRLTDQDLKSYDVTMPMEDFSVQPSAGEVIGISGYSAFPRSPQSSRQTDLHSQPMIMQPRLPYTTLPSQPAKKLKEPCSQRPNFIPRIAVKPQTKRSYRVRKKTKKTVKPLEKSTAAGDSVAAIKVFVFTCGHACGVCNSSKSKQWLTESGFQSTMPLPAPVNMKNLENSNIRTHRRNSPPVSTGSSQAPSAVPHLRKLLGNPPGSINATPLTNKQRHTFPYMQSRTKDGSPAPSGSTTFKAPFPMVYTHPGIMQLQNVPLLATPVSPVHQLSGTASSKQPSISSLLQNVQLKRDSDDTSKSVSTLTILPQTDSLSPGSIQFGVPLLTPSVSEKGQPIVASSHSSPASSASGAPPMTVLIPVNNPLTSFSPALTTTSSVQMLASPQVILTSSNVATPHLPETAALGAQLLLSLKNKTNEASSGTAQTRAL